jgi:hypothetical protein
MKQFCSINTGKLEKSNLLSLTGKMRGKSIVLFVIMGFYSLTLPAQHILQSELNLPRAGDEIIKQQVRYKDPGRSGEHVIWNFGQLESINDEYSLLYSEPELIGDSIYILGLDTIYVSELLDDYLFIGTEHNTLYYYRFAGDRLWTLGHENALTLLQYSEPLLNGVYPLHYSDSCMNAYSAHGMYSMTVPFETTGNVAVKADAFGKMILPSGDTLKQVMRTKTRQIITEMLPTETGDTLILNTRLDTYKWYSKGYRYPVFETVKTVIRRDSTETNQFETAFFYPPQEHYYLEEDEENAALLEEENPEEEDPWAGLSYNVFPNPVKTFLEVEYDLPRPANIRIEIRNSMGLMVWSENKGYHPVGIGAFSLNLSGITIGNYILDIWLDDHLISRVLMKR